RAHGRGCRSARRRAAPRGDGACRACACDRALRVARHRAPAGRDLRARRVNAIVRSKRWRLLLPVPLLVGAGVLVWLRGPNWHQVGQSFGNVRWYWVVAAIALNLLSVVLRSAAWNTVIHQAMPPPRPAF